MSLAARPVQVSVAKTPKSWDWAAVPEEAEVNPTRGGWTWRFHEMSQMDGLGVHGSLTFPNKISVPRGHPKSDCPGYRAPAQAFSVTIVGVLRTGASALVQKALLVA